jgi:pimeloyl-ACP methyl ester carboxylesterase
MPPSGYMASMGYNVVRASEWHTFVLPKNWQRDGSKRGVIYCHGAGQDARAAAGWDKAQPNTPATNQRLLAGKIAAAGFPLVAIDAGLDAWGNDTAITAMGQAQTYLQGALGAKAGKILMLGVSMGNLTALNYTRQNRALVAAVVGIMPLSDLNHYFVNSGNAASVNAAYGGAYSDTTNAGGLWHNPTKYAAADLAGLAYKAWYGASDTIVPPATVTNVLSLIGGTASGVSLAGQVHGETLVGAVNADDVVAFLLANEA